MKGMFRFFVCAGLIAAIFFVAESRPLRAYQQTSSSSSGTSPAKSDSKTDPANVPDAPQPQQKSGNKAPAKTKTKDSSGSDSSGTGSSESSGASAPLGKEVPPQSAPEAPPDTPKDPATAKPSPAGDNPFPEDVSRHAAQQQTQDIPEGEKPGSAPENKAAGDNPFPEDISRKAAKGSSSGGGEDTPPKVPLPPGVSSSQSSALPEPGQTPHPMQVTDASRAKQDNQVGDFYLAQGNLKGAYERYKDAVAYDPTNVDAIFGLAEASKGLKQYAESQRNYLLYLNILPNGPKAKQALKALTAIEGKH
jgi:Tetratricopeptide repeat